MDTREVMYLERSRGITGYRVGIMRKPAFRVIGYSKVIPPNSETEMVPRVVGELTADGSLDVLRKATSATSWILGLGSWDEECQPGGMRYTMCIEETELTDLSRIARRHPVHTQRFEACEWMCFEVPRERFISGAFWKDDPYRMLRALGYRFHLRVGVHFDASPPDHDEASNWGMEFWISVARETDGCAACSVRGECGRMQPFMTQSQ